MIRIGLVGEIGSGKSHIANNFGYPVFNADIEVAKLYKKNRKIFIRLNKVLPNYFHSFPIDKKDVLKAILDHESNLKKIIKIIHEEIRIKLSLFLKKNKNKKILILDIPLLLENKLYKKNDILIFVQSNKLDILKRLRKRKNFNQKLFNKFKKIQLPLAYKKKKSRFIIRNDFTNKSIRNDIKDILKEIL